MNNKPLTTYLRELCDQTTIHGVRYITERKRHWSERLWWVTACVLSLCLCVWSIYVIWVSWNERPVKITNAENGLSITEFPFPTVTICPKTKTTRAKLDLVSIKRHQSNVTTKKNILLQTLAHLCPLFKPFFGSFEDKFVNDSIYDIMIDIAPTIDLITHCFWQDEQFSCSKIFTPTLTEYGLCFIFNALNSREIFTDKMAPGMMMVKNRPNMSRWSIETGYERGNAQTHYPWRTSNSGYRAGLVVYLELKDEDLNYACQETGLGFAVTLNPPVETNERSANVYQVPILENTEIAIQPQIITTSEKLRKYSPIERQCYFSNERKLRFFNFYTQRNCYSECLSNFTEHLCGCVKFSMPRDKNTSICGAGNIPCYLSTENKLFEEDIDDDLIDSISDLFRTQCDCLPGCSSISYGAIVDHVTYDINILHKTGLGMNTRPSRLAIFFHDHTAKTQQRIETMTYTGFLADCGGLLGLFLGISVLSIVELIYYFTLRLFWNIRRSNDVLPFHN